MNYFWITQSPWSQKKELENGWISARPAKKYNHYREMVKTIKKGDLIFFCSRGVINYVGFALASSMSETDKTGEIWKVKIKSSQLEMPIDISNHSEYLLEKRAEKYSPITYLGTAHQGYCSVISKVIAWYLLSRAGVYYKNNSIIELEKSIGYRDTKSVSHRVSNLNALMSSLSRENILDTLDKFGELIYSDYKYQNSTTYDLEYDGVRYPPKVIFGISAITLINRPLFADEFSGGVNSPCFHILEALGFNIVKKNKSSDGNEFEDIDFLINDIEMIENDDSLSVTEREQLIAARKGQGKYRKELIKLYGKCIVTGIPYEFMLRASHIKPWRVSNNKERLDPFNGFLLSSNVDILFDKGFLSFENSGELILCDELKNEFTLRLLGIDLRKKVMIPLGTFQYLDWHRKNIFGRYKGK